MSNGDDALARWQRNTEIPLAVAALVFLAAYAWPILDPGLPQAWVDICDATTWVIWGLMVADFAVRLGIAPRRLAFLRANLFDLAIIVAPFLRPLKLLRLITVVSVLNRRLTVTLRRHVALYAVSVSSLVVFVGALAILETERGVPGANITTFDEALWWTLVTITTVGYGDHFPVTTHGRMIAVGLFIGGISLLGVVTGTVASWFTEKVEDSQRAALATQEQVALLTAEVRALRTELAERGEGQDREQSRGRLGAGERSAAPVGEGRAGAPGGG
ncbi:voltage-gated potassium channel [Nocardiopsis mwathae]|uniref:Voltage-gated potassium channel n=1 Tax=Nocardiopsis mwathae TaxID=1472723 RepID=A0A7W9YI04_9ACTN|nr:potassium channel family protein [Nocardiopsis mwathae]MBB6171551.1 voltage-gated potassium channel [Nocardiopsis mwathae]